MTTNKPEVVACATHHDEPMLFPSKREAAMYCDDGEEPLALIHISDYEALQAECDRLQAEYEQLISYTKNGIECFASPCPEHSGINTPPFSEFQERYGRLCLMCVVDERDTLRAENDELRQALNRMTAGLDNTIRHSQSLCAVTEEPGEAQSDAGHLLKKLEASHD